MSELKNWVPSHHTKDGTWIPAQGDCEKCGARLEFRYDPVFCPYCDAVYNMGGTRLVDPSLWEEPWDDDY